VFLRQGTLPIYGAAPSRGDEYLPLIVKYVKIEESTDFKMADVGVGCLIGWVL